MRSRGWHRLLAKRGYAGQPGRHQQSLRDHSLVGLDLLFSLAELLARSDALALLPDELSQAILGILVHDAGKAGPEWQAWICANDGSPSPGQYDEGRIRHEVAWFANQLQIPVHEDAITAALRTMRAGRSAASTAAQVLGAPHVLSRWIVIADVVAAIDHACSAAGLLDAAETLRRGYLGNKLVLDYHLVRLRGLSTPYLHAAMEQAFQARDWVIALRFPEGTIYAAHRADPPVVASASEVGQRLGALLDEALTGDAGGNRAELIVNRDPRARVFPKPELFDPARLRDYLEVGATRAGRETFRKKTVVDQRKVLTKYLERSERGVRVEDLNDSATWQREVDRVASAHPEMMILKVFRDATIVKRKEGKIFDPSRFAEAAKDALDGFQQRVREGYNKVFTAGAYEQLCRTSTLQPFQDMGTVDRFWKLSASQFGRQAPEDRVDLLDPRERERVLVEALVKIFESALAELPSGCRPLPITAEALATAFSRDLVHPTAAQYDPEAVRHQFEHYVGGKEAAKRPSGRHICPICNDPFANGRPATADLLENPEGHTNRAQALDGIKAPIVICEICRLDRVFGQLIAGTRPGLTFVLYPRHNIGRDVGRRLVERAREFMRRASVFMSEIAPGSAIKPSLSRTEDLAEKLGAVVLEGLSGAALADLFSVRTHPAERREELENLVREQFGQTLEEWNAACDTAYQNESAFLEAVEGGEIEGALELRAEALNLKPTFNLVAVTPHLLMLPSSDPLQRGTGDKKESDVNAGIRRIFVALVLALGFEVAVAFLRDGIPLEPDQVEGVVAVPPHPELRALFRGSWIDLVETKQYGRRKPGAEDWLHAIAAASRLGRTEAFPERSALFMILTQPTPGHLVRRIEQKSQRPVRVEEMQLIADIAKVLPGYDAALYDAASDRR